MTNKTDEYIFLGTYGHVVALDKANGDVIWQTSLPNTGYQYVSMLVEDGKLFCATAGRAFALDPANGRILWTNHLPGMGTGTVGLCSMHHSPDASDGAAADIAARLARDSSAHGAHGGD